jgi:hypothetical protein
MNPIDAAALLFIREAIDDEAISADQLTPILKGGSDRIYYRVGCQKGKSYIFMHYDPLRTENVYYAPIATFLEGIGIRVPHIIRHDSKRCYLLMEDLGETDLWAFREASWENRRMLYRDSLAEIMKLHEYDIQEFHNREVPLMPGFDTALYRWEHDYFIENFVIGVCGIVLDSKENDKLRQELTGLIERISNSGRCLIHRDFQSQNILIRDALPSLIDFQGVRYGSRFYDLGSLLYDPYVDLAEGERMELLSFYFEQSRTAGDSFAEFEKAFREAASQRLMQALGAYGFLGIRKGKAAFLGHIPSALDNLLDACGRADCIPALKSLLMTCRDAYYSKRPA